MAAPDKTAPDVTRTEAGDTRGYPEPQPDGKDDAQRRGQPPKKDSEDGGLERDVDGGDGEDGSDGTS